MDRRLIPTFMIHANKSKRREVIIATAEVVNTQGCRAYNLTRVERWNAKAITQVMMMVMMITWYDFSMINYPIEARICIYSHVCLVLIVLL